VVARRTTTVAEEAMGTRGGVVARKTSERARRTPGVVALPQCISLLPFCK
jgi:hypothetical protein